MVFNALSFQMILASPMILYARGLGASATVLGIIAGMMPLLVIFQIPAARHVSRIGYKKFVLAGWSTRVVFIFGMALVPLASGILNPTTRLALILFLLFGFNLSRGISSAAWLPWITTLVPSQLRGRYLGREAAFVNVSSFAAFLVAAFGLGSEPHPWQFSAIFVFSGLCGLLSLSYMKRIPDAEIPEQAKSGNEPVPWLEISRFAPFRKLLHMNIAWALAVGGMSTFTVVFLKAETAMGEGEILLLTSIAFLGGLSSLWFLGSRLDHMGSKPALALSCFTWLAILVIWILLAGRVIDPGVGLLLLLQFLMGLGSSMVNMANTRLAMAVVPVMGRSHFFALYSVIGSLALGLAPIVWGLLIDLFIDLKYVWHGFEFNRFTLFFIAVFVAFVITLRQVQKLEEPQAADMETLLRDILEQSPLRIWLRFWPRNGGPN